MIYVLFVLNFLYELRGLPIVVITSNASFFPFREVEIKWGLDGVRG